MAYPAVPFATGGAQWCHPHVYAVRAISMATALVLHFLFDAVRAQLFGLVLAAALLQVLGVASRLRDIRAAP